MISVGGVTNRAIGVETAASSTYTKNEAMANDSQVSAKGFDNERMIEYTKNF